ncbi:MAG: hypothetical protein AAB656_03625, partial [Patescibacteria group bacterium]
MKKTFIYCLLVAALAVPTFFRMVRYGIHTTQDYHFFRLLEFDKCVRAFTFPCRWAPDAGLGYGEPLFNFYGQLVYAVGEIFHLVGFSLIDSIKMLFILSLLLSGLSMFFLAKKIWGNSLAGIVAAALYMYAPYRAVDVWVRGALPEAFSFVIFPLIILAIEKKHKLWFGILVAVLILTHNLSLVLFLPVLMGWIVYRKAWGMIPAALGSALLSAFYILPVIFEAKYVNLESTIRGYFDFRAHFTTLSQLLISRFWGYGASLWGPVDDLSLSVGQIQWILPVATFIAVVLTRKLREYRALAVLIFLGWVSLFLTHNKSAFIWELLPPMAYIQFPWRFLGPATFCFALASGSVVNLIKNKKIIITIAICAIAIVLNVGFFKEDIWQNIKDEDLTTGEAWNIQRTASIGDFWPNFGHEIPSKPATGEYINYFSG